MSLDVTKIKQVPLRESQYIKEEIKKTQIVLHHTAGNSSGVGTIKMWDTDDRGRIATCVTISGKGASKDTYDGEICQAFSSKYWAYHLGIKRSVFDAYGVPYTIATANSEMIPPNSVNNSIIVGQGNIVSYLTTAGANSLFTITELGMPDTNTGTTGFNSPTGSFTG